MKNGSKRERSGKISQMVVGICEYQFKKRFATKADANRVVKMLKGASQKRERVYQCAFCGDWHLTSKPKA